MTGRSDSSQFKIAVLTGAGDMLLKGEILVEGENARREMAYSVCEHQKSDALPYTSAVTGVNEATGTRHTTLSHQSHQQKRWPVA